MKKLFWYFTIRKKINKAIAITKFEKKYFDNALLNNKQDADMAKYYSKMIELKEEVLYQLNNLIK